MTKTMTMTKMIATAALLIVLPAIASAFQASAPMPMPMRTTATSLRSTDGDFNYLDAEIDRAMGKTVDADDVDDDDLEDLPPSAEECLSFLQSLGAITGRGEFASDAQKEAADQVVEKLEAQNPTRQPALDDEKQVGRWELLYSSTQPFRGSPFFLAGRAVCETDEQAKQFDWFCQMHRKALAISNIGAVRQIVSRDRIVSEFEVKAGAVPFLNDFTPFSYSGGLPVTIDGAIVSTADWTPTITGDGWELFMDTVEIKGSNVPGLRQVLDAGLKLQSRELGNFLESNVDSYSNPRPVFRTTYLDDSFRISRDQDDNVFCYVKTDDDPTPTDYTSIDADLGVSKLLEGFNDAVTKLYL